MAKVFLVKSRSESTCALTRARSLTYGKLVNRSSPDLRFTNKFEKFPAEVCSNFLVMYAATLSPSTRQCRSINGLMTK